MKHDLKNILTFTYVAKLKSFSKAAKALKISRTIVTTRIADLEASFGMNLLARTTREVNLTTDGKNFLDHCNSIMEKVDKLDDFIDNNKGIRGVLRIILPPYFSRYHIVPYFDEFLTKYPNLKLDIALTENPINIINEGYDLQVRIQIPEEEGLEVAKLMDNHKIVCASPDYIAKHGKPKTPDDLLNHNCLVFGENNVWKFKDKNTHKIYELKNVSGNIKCDNGEIIKELTLEGLGITLKSSRDADNEIKEKKLIILLKDYEVMNKTQFYVVYPSGKNMSPKIKAFINFFQKKLDAGQIQN